MESTRQIFYSIDKRKSQEGQVFPEHTCVMLIKMLVPKRERARDWDTYLKHQRNVENCWALPILEETTEIVILACEIGVMGKTKTFKDW